MRIPLTVCLCLVLLLTTAREARAYTDPGSGALIWQMLVAALVGFLFYFRRFWCWLRSRFGGSDE